MAVELNQTRADPLGSRRSKFFSSLDDTLGILSKIEDLREAVDDVNEDEEEDGDVREVEEDVEEEEEEEVQPRVSVIGPRVFLARSDNVPEPEEALGSLARDG